ncbi:alpha-N-acetylgalactosaminide alpha-2,6-sialyltransferase 3-like [Saccoglossus kowalevskii]|uniref:Alpha-N-acetylgalactosaminide alpha-2,6-sialyltransferase 3-like n=1 Tax=Saccoglossus kowalevskii TaxID=10224 RepID=A0ABM0MXY8_SACKO|nr:PREDICTED: alpha-N-acetylgalactosaminide alpha-2,6-sialyltransferase 3-like [Saccoglossus kowalevskii]
MKTRKRKIILIAAATVLTCAIFYATTNHHATIPIMRTIYNLDVGGSILSCISRGNLNNTEKLVNFLCGDNEDSLKRALDRVEIDTVSEDDMHKYRLVEAVGNKDEMEKERIRKMFSHNPSGFVRMQNEKELNLHCDVCALVSASGQMLGSGAGDEIDNATCVIRMNTAPTRGYEKDVGTRTTLRMTSFVNVQWRLFDKEELFEKEGVTGTFVIWSSNTKEIRSVVTSEARRLMKRHPDLDPYISTFELMDYADLLFLLETGQERDASGSWLTTGWFTLIMALKMCEHVKIFGMIESGHCSTIRYFEDRPHHYFEPTGPKECAFTRLHESGLRGGHRFHTEKYIFKKWARVFNITFHHPSWDLDQDDGKTIFLLSENTHRRSYSGPARW